MRIANGLRERPAVDRYTLTRLRTMVLARSIVRTRQQTLPLYVAVFGNNLRVKNRSAVRSAR